MNDKSKKFFHARWYEIVVAVLIGGLLMRPIGIFLHEVDDLISDGSFFRFDREHHLTHGYIQIMHSRLAKLQRTALKYSAHHAGSLAFLRSTKTVKQALWLYADDKDCLTNLSGHHPFQPNSSIANYKWSQIKNPDHVVLFYDESPPETYTRIYFVILNGRGHDVSATEWIRLQRLWQENQKIAAPVKSSTR